MKLPAWSAQPKRGQDTLYAFFRKPWDGKQTSIPLEVNNQDEARQVAPGLIQAYIQSNDPSLTGGLTGREQFKDYLSEFVKDRYIGKAEGTVKASEGDCRRFIESLKSPLIADCNWQVMRGYLDGLRLVREPRGLYMVIVNLRVFYDYLKEHDLVKENLPRKYPLPSTSDFYVNEVVWETPEYETFYEAASPEDQTYLHTIWHSGMDLKDWFMLRKKHILIKDGQPVISKLREKATSPLQVINFPLENCPAKEGLMKAWKAAKHPDDRLHALSYSDEKYDIFNYSSSNRRKRLWQRLWPATVPKTLKQIRHTFVTECVSGKRFGRMVPEVYLEKWMGWSPGSKVGRRFYTHIPASETAEFMRPFGNLILQPQAEA